MLQDIGALGSRHTQLCTEKAFSGSL